MRSATIERRTRETDITVTLELDGSGKVELATGIGMLDHLLESFARHGLFDLSVRCKGDLHIDDHHSAEDIAICLGQALDKALGDKRGIVRAGHSYVPMDEALAFVAIDLSGRPYAVLDVDMSTPMLGGLASDLVRHFLETFATHGRMNLHARVLYGRNDHHRAEAVFKAMARALDAASRVDERLGGEIPSTKGAL